MLVPAAALLRGADWPDWRGPSRTGASAESGLPTAWSPAGENLAWKAPYGGRSAPVVFGDRLYLQNTSGEGAAMQERLMCFHADTGKLLWEHKYNLFTSDVPPHRIAWASPVVDPASGNVFAFSGNGLLMSFSQGRQAALGAIARRRVRDVDDARRPRVVADHRRAAGDRQRLDVQLGPARGRRAPLSLVRQDDGPCDLAQRAGGPPYGHDLRQSVHRRRQRHAHVLLGRQRRRDARAEGGDRRKDLELDGQPARPEYRGADDRVRT